VNKEPLVLKVDDTILAQIDYLTEPVKIVKERFRRELLLEKKDGTRVWMDEAKLKKFLKVQEEEAEENGQQTASGT
jgi:hypothetical protein